MAARRRGVFRKVHVKQGDNLKSVYAKVRRSFTAADLARYAEDEEMLPAEKVLAELETVHREEFREPACDRMGF